MFQFQRKGSIVDSDPIEQSKVFKRHYALIL